MGSVIQTDNTSSPGGGPAVMPFGKHKGHPIEQIETGYLRWAVEKQILSSGLDASVRNELTRRGITVPPQPPPLPRHCREHPTAGIVAYWMTMRGAGRRMIRGECRDCGRSVGSLPQVEPYRSMADAGTDGTALLRVLVLAEELGVTVTRRGDDLDLAPYDRTTPELRALARQARATLAPMLPPGGRT